MAQIMQGLPALWGPLEKAWLTLCRARADLETPQFTITYNINSRL